MKLFSSRSFRFLISLALLAAVIWWADWRAIWTTLRQVDLLWVGVATLLAVVDRLIITYRWRLLLVVRGLHLAFAPLWRIQMAANFLGSFLPSSLGVDAIRIAALARRGYATTEVLATTLVDRASLVVATMAFGSLMILALAGSRFPSDLVWVVHTATLVGVLACAIMLHPSVRRWLAASLIERLPATIYRRVIETGRAMIAYRHESRTLAWVTAVTLALFALRLLFAKSLALACGVEVPITDLALVIPILWIVVMIPITVGGIGLQDAGYIGLMGLLGVAPAVAVGMSLIEHVVSRAVSLPGAFFLADVTGSGARNRADT